MDSLESQKQAACQLLVTIQGIIVSKIEFLRCMVALFVCSLVRLNWYISWL